MMPTASMGVGPEIGFASQQGIEDKAPDGYVPAA